MAHEDTLKRNFEEYYQIAEYSLSKRKFNSAVTLYYKALVELCDLELLRKTGKIGVNHTERFNLLRKTSPELYIIASKLFTFYRDSYSNEISETVAKQFKIEVDNASRNVLNKK